MSVLYDKCLTCWVYCHILDIAVSLSCLILWVNEVVSVACLFYMTSPSFSAMFLKRWCFFYVDWLYY